MSLDYLPWRRPESYADRPCVRDADTDLSYADFGARVDVGAEQLAAERGVTTGDVVAVMLPNRVVLTAGEATHQLRDSRAVLVVASDPSRTGDTPVLQGYPNLYPKEIEAAVVGAPGEVPVAFVAPRPGREIDVPALLERCRGQLVKIKVPVAIHPVEATPRNAAGKVGKPALRRPASTLVTQGA